jgi:hypothetical protein
MSKKLSSSPSWETSSFGHPADVSTLERAALSEHLSLCAALRGPMQALQSGAETLQGLLAGRVITSVLTVLLLAGGVWLLR